MGGRDNRKDDRSRMLDVWFEERKKVHAKTLTRLRKDIERSWDQKARSDLEEERNTTPIGCKVCGYVNAVCKVACKDGIHAREWLCTRCHHWHKRITIFKAYGGKFLWANLFVREAK